MKIQKNQTLTTMAMILILTLSAFMANMQFANAHTPQWNIPTYAFVTVSPSTVGVGQYAQVVMWLDKYPPTAGGLGGDRWHNFTLSVTAPNGDKQIIGPIEGTSQVGSTYYVFNPTQVGNYTFVFSWPGQTLTNGTGEPEAQGVPYVGDYFQPATSDPATLTVTQSPITGWQEPPLPTGFWKLPINDANRAWSMLASNWLKGSWLLGNWQNEGQAPNSAHVLWQEPITTAYPGGIVDAQWPGQPVDVNDYESPWSAPIIINGFIYFNAPPTAESDKYGYYAINLYTGQQAWYQNGTSNLYPNPITYSDLAGGTVTTASLPLAQVYPSLSFGQLYHYNSVNGQGVLAYLWITVGSTWYMIDAATGNWILTLKNVPGGTAITDQDGSLLRYSYNAATGQFLCWNSSQSIPPSGPTSTEQQQWKPRTGAVIDAVNDSSWTTAFALGQTSPLRLVNQIDVLPRSGYTMNVTGPKNLPATMNVLQDSNRVPKQIFLSNLPLAAGLQGGTDVQTYQIAVLNINEHATSYSPLPSETFTQNNNLGFGLTLLWNRSFTYPLGGNKTFSLGPISYADGVFTLWCKETRQWWGFSLADGSLLWGPDASQTQWDMYGNGGAYADGKLFSGNYGGILNAYNIKTGKLLWTYTAANIGYESPYGNYPISIGAIADGKVYLYSTEHSPTKPLWRGSYLRCVNETDGTELWKLLDFNMGMAVAEGYIVTASQYDNMIYCIGKGPTATTVSTQEFAAPLGTPVLIKGTVTDQSPGAPGTPAITDASMEQWMEYLYEQQVMPTNATGVPVTLSAFDPNNNTYIIRTTTTDTSGSYSISWTPPVTGVYTITATFGGSNSYGGSSAETSLLVSAAPSAKPVSTSTATSTPPATTSTSTPTIPPTITPTSASPSSAPPPSSGIPTMTYVAIAAAVIIILAIAAAIIIRRRK